MFASNWIALVVTFAVALVWLRVMDTIAHRGWISSSLSRKLIHLGTGPVFVLCWLLFNAQPAARFLAALVPAAITVQFVLVGTGLMKDQASVDSMSRSGDRREILRGPLYYGIAFVLLTVLFWKDNPIGIVALMVMCGGDGLADIVGSRSDSRALPWSPKKSWAGSLAMLLGGWTLSVAVMAAFVAAGVFSAPLSHYLAGITAIAVGCTLVESLPFRDIDNISVPLTAVVLGLLFLI